ncbi:endonuclease I family protein [Paenibacillus alvei]|uniref:Ribonuclease n=1 Tax=Paenibacillus alvei TaxID=44250 RepID=A0AAP7DI60_PAEAL|nr:endonuclease [Paenibacillus alvei]NOJ71318.1 ribonuclease [Paenibacillus alvei]
MKRSCFIIALLMLAMSVTSCGANNIGTANTPSPLSNTSKQSIRQTEVGRGNFRVLNTNLDQAYYKNAIGKTGEDLKEALHQIIKNQTVLEYDDAWEALGDTDEDPNNSNNVLLLYAGRSESKANHGSNSGQWNREHVWAQHHGNFGRTRGIGSDLHNLKPEDVIVNRDRGHLDFDKTETQKSGENKYPNAPDTFKDGDSWEPRDEVKGDIARIFLYMDTRYGAGDQMDLKVVNRTTEHDGTAPVHGKLATLLKWHNEDPVDAFEMRRNNVIYEKYQHNRNPFIDHPEWVASIWGRNH